MKKIIDPRKLRDLKPAEYNPRIISDWQAQALFESLKRFGDLSGIVYNVKTNRIIGGHQRVSVLDGNYEITKKPHQDSTGTVSIGFIETPEGQIQYREVNWDEDFEKAANIAANKMGGEWDEDKLALMLNDLMQSETIDISATGFDDDEVDDLLLLLDDDQLGGEEGEGDEDDGDDEGDDGEGGGDRAGDLYDEFVDDIAVQQKTLYPSDNLYEIPNLKLKHQATEIVIPVVIWGSIKRSLEMRGTWLFYTSDERYTALTKDPRPVIRTNCVAAAEPNFSSYEQMSFAEGVYRIFQKRWIARFWQEKGPIKILVDLNVSPKFYEQNLMGVPAGWKAYCTRGYDDRLAYTEKEFEMACERAGTSDITFIVYGGGQKVKEACQANNWRWQQETIEVRTGRQRD